MYLPWKCEHERHTYEKCQYLECVIIMLRKKKCLLPKNSFPPPS